MSSRFETVFHNPVTEILKKQKGWITHFVSVAIIVAALLFWQLRSMGNVTITAFVLYILLAASWIGYGLAFSRLISPRLTVALEAPQQLLIGFFIANTLGFLLALASPMGLIWNGLVLASAGIGAGLLALRNMSAPKEISWPSIMICMISAIAATIWCNDVQPPFLRAGDQLVLQAWQDVSIHVRTLSEFAHSHGAKTLQDVRLSGVIAPVYHFASYITPAMLVAALDARAVEIYAAFQLPFGIFLTGLAAYTLLTPLFGRWPALVAAAAVLLMPDAFFQGFGNRFLSYFFQTQVNLGTLYGIAVAALAWMFVMQGTKQGNLALILLGWIWLGICLVYKAQLFVANAYLILLYPCLFTLHYSRSARIIAWTGLTAVFLIVIWYSQHIPSIPLIKLDFSGVGSYTIMLLNSFDPGLWQHVFTDLYAHGQHGKVFQSLMLVTMVSLCTFGLWIFVLPVVAYRCRKVRTAVLSLPVLVILNYLLMTVGLAQDTHGVGAVEELQNRPLVWAYFVVAAWSTAAMCSSFSQASRCTQVLPNRYVLGVLVVLSLLVPLQIGRNLQTFPAWKGFADFRNFNSIPVCFSEVADHIRRNSQPEDIVQHNLGDSRLILTALTERQAFVANSNIINQNDEVKRRVELVRDVMSKSVDEIEAFMLANDISWLFWEGRPPNWEPKIKATASCGDFHAYDFRHRIK